MNQEFCCNSMQSHINRTEQSGFSIGFSGSENAPLELKFHAVEPKMEKEFAYQIKNSFVTTNILIEGKIRIKYCPWCGCHLKQIF